ncbi:MAG TPA: GNAT family N-acetyltransferase [Chitinispirillaceae bacterium]|nr:GNAT family N-acetyltransferase [Chitinispirillaceae bacterium]
MKINGLKEIDESELEIIIPLWVDLCKKCSMVTPFQFPQWLVPWWKNLGGGKLKILTFSDNELLTGVAPLFMYENESGKKIISFVGAGITDYLDIIALPGYEQSIAESVLGYLADISSQWDECDFPDVPESSILLHCKYPDVFMVKRSECNICSHLELPSNQDRFRTQIPKKLRKNLSHAARMLSASGGYHLEIADESNVESFLYRLFDLHQARWESRNQKGVLYNDILRTFHKQAASGLIKNELLRIYIMKYNQMSIAVYHALVNKKTVYAYLGGFDPLMEQFSPGALLLFHVVEDSLKRGAQKFDFLRGNEAYKNYWRPVFHFNYRIQINKRI